MVPIFAVIPSCTMLTPLEADVTSCQGRLMPISWEVILAPEAEGEKVGWTYSRELLPVGPEASSWAWGDTKFLLCSHLVSCFRRDITLGMPNSLLYRPPLHAESQPLSPERGEGLPKFRQPSAAESGLIFSSYLDPWSFYSVKSGWRLNPKRVVWRTVSVMFLSDTNT